MMTTMSDVRSMKFSVRPLWLRAFRKTGAFGVLKSELQPYCVQEFVYGVPALAGIHSRGCLPLPLPHATLCTWEAPGQARNRPRDDNGKGGAPPATNLEGLRASAMLQEHRPSSLARIGNDQPARRVQL